MKINEVIVEGWMDVLKRLGTDVAGGQMNVDATRDTLSKVTGGKVQATKSPTTQRTFYTDFDKLKPTHKGEIFVVKHNNQEFFKSYVGRWYRKDTVSNQNEFVLNAPLNGYKEYEILDNALLKNGFRIVQVKMDSPDTNHWTGKGQGRVVTPDQAADLSRTEEPVTEPESGLVDKDGNPLK